MLLIPRRPTLTGVAVGGVIVRPACGVLNVAAESARMLTSIVLRLPIAPPSDDGAQDFSPTLITQRMAFPGVG